MLQNKIKELEALKLEVPEQAKRIAIKYKEKILDYIREKQLFEKGIDGNGNKLTPEYKPFTIAIKRQKGQPTDRVTLEDTGSFYKGFDLIYTDQNALGIFSRDEKTPDLIDKYGADIFTFTTKNIEEINEQIFETELIKWLLNTKTFTQI